MTFFNYITPLHHTVNGIVPPGHEAGMFGFLDAFFTAASAFSDTGLVVTPT